MAKESFIEKFARENDLVDERNIITCAQISCSNGNYGMAGTFVNGSKIHLYEPVGFTKVGDYIETIDLKDVTDIKCCKIILFYSLKFKYNGYTYKFSQFPQPKKLFSAVEEFRKL